MYILFSFLIILVLNLLAGLLFSGYEWANVGISSAVLLFNYLFLEWVRRSKLKDALKVSLSCILPVIGVIEFVLALMAPATVTENVLLMVIVVLLALQALLSMALNLVSSKID